MRHPRAERREPSRREFLHAGAVCAAAAGTCLCGAGGCKMISGVGATPALAGECYTLHAAPRHLEVHLARAAELARAGGSAKLLDRQLPEPLILASPQLGRYVAVSLGCTHGGRELEYDHEGQRFRCVSFGGSEFALDGARLAGPAERALNAYPTRLDGNRLVVALDPARDKLTLDADSERW